MSDDEPPAWPDDAVEVGSIAGAWGVKGWIKVQPYAGDPQALFSSKRWFLAPPEGVRRPGEPPLPRLLRIVQARDHGDGVIAQVGDIDDRTTAERLRGARVFVSRGSFPSPAPDEYYWVDLIGLAVVNRQGETLGTVAGLIDTGPHSVLRVARPAAETGAGAEDDERLIPFVSAYVDEVMLAQRRIVVDWGLDY
ncbi:MAG TPA: ribosome maturation factor RimM [Burkholderiaceae bacterium]|nr:ribosome maturation factor RimM [Burkholderiaceae bacterium]